MGRVLSGDRVQNLHGSFLTALRILPLRLQPTHKPILLVGKFLNEGDVFLKTRHFSFYKLW